MIRRGLHRGAARPPISAFRELLFAEAKLAWRTPTGLITGLGLPVMLLAIFSSIPSFRKSQPNLGGLTYLSIYVPILIVFVIAILALTGLSTTLAAYRQQGVLRRLSTTPAPPSWVLAAQVVVNVAIAVVALLLLIVISVTALGAQGPKQVPGFILSLVLNMAALFAIGLFISAIARTSQAAGVIGGALFYPMMFFAGLWIPREIMPHVLLRISDYTPLGAGVQAMQGSMQGSFPSARPVLVLLGYAAVFAYASIRYFKWE